MEAFTNVHKVLKNRLRRSLFLKNLFRDLTLSKLFLEDLPKYITEILLSSTLFCDKLYL